MSEDRKPYELKVTDKRPDFKPETLPVPTGETSIVMVALQKGYDPAFIEKMMDLEERRYKEEARRAYYSDLASMQTELPQVKKDKFNTQFQSRYTSLENYLETYRPFMGKWGFSPSFEPDQSDDKLMKVTCILTHRMGHSESKTMAGPIDQAPVGKESGKAARNPLQNIKSTFTYLRSATFEAVMGVAGTDASQDDDGNNAGAPEFITPEQTKQITDLIEAKNVDSVKFLEYMKVETVDTIHAKDFAKAMGVLKKAKGQRDPGQEG